MFRWFLLISQPMFTKNTGPFHIYGQQCPDKGLLHLFWEWYQIHIFWFQECPSGIVNEETFKDIYAQFFPQGGK